MVLGRIYVWKSTRESSHYAIFLGVSLCNINNLIRRLAIINTAAGAPDLSGNFRLK